MNNSTLLATERFQQQSCHNDVAETSSRQNYQLNSTL